MDEPVIVFAWKSMFDLGPISDFQNDFEGNYIDTAVNVNDPPLLLLFSTLELYFDPLSIQQANKSLYN